jgi:hypothetical protein
VGFYSLTFAYDHTIHADADQRKQACKPNPGLVIRALLCRLAQQPADASDELCAGRG